jgi:hypothetical protein
MQSATTASGRARLPSRNRTAKTCLPLLARFVRALYKRWIRACFRISNRNNTAFKIPRNTMKTHAEPNPNRNTAAVLRSPKDRYDWPTVATESQKGQRHVGATKAGANYNPLITNRTGSASGRKRLLYPVRAPQLAPRSQMTLPQSAGNAFARRRRFPRHPGAASGQSDSMLHCYIGVPVASSHSSLATSHCIFNRQPRRLEIIASHTKQTPAHQINRQLSATSPHDLSANPPHRLRHGFLTGTQLHSEIG